MSKLYVIVCTRTKETLIDTLCRYPETSLLRFLEAGKEGWFAFQRANPTTFNPTAANFLDWFEVQTEYAVQEATLVLGDDV